MRIALFLVCLGVSVAYANNITRRAGGCPKYYVVNTRGTGEFQAQSSGFRIANAQLQAKVSGGTLYATRYSANFAQISAGGTADIISYVTKTLATDPGACFVLEGYSQGAMATVNALPKLTSAFDSIKAVMLIGNPARGLERALAPNISQWKSKTLDICAQMDPVCVVPTADGPLVGGHLAYPFSMPTQSKMANFAASALQNAAPAAGGASAGGASCGATPAASGGGIAKRLMGMMPTMPTIPGLGSMPGLGALTGGSASTPPAAAAAGGSTGCTPAASAAPASSGGLASLLGGGGGASSNAAPAPASGGLGGLLGGGGGLPGLSALKLKRDDVTLPSTRSRHLQRKKRRLRKSSSIAGD